MSGDTLPLQGRARPAADLSCYLPNVKIMAKVMWGQWHTALRDHMEFDDLYHIGVIGMIRAHSRWNPELGAKFLTFADYAVRGAMWDAIRSDPQIRVSRANQPHKWLNLSPLRGPYLDDPHNIYEDPCLNTETQHPHDTTLLKKMMATLNARELRMIYLYYYDDYTLLEIAKRFGITEGRMSQLFDKLMPKLKRVLERKPVPRGEIKAMRGVRKSGPKGPTTYTKFEAFNVKRMHGNGKSLAQIAKEIGRPKSSVHNMLHRDTTHVPKRRKHYHRINITAVVFQEIARRGAFGESVDGVLRRVLELPTE